LKMTENTHTIVTHLPQCESDSSHKIIHPSTRIGAAQSPPPRFLPTPLPSRQNTIGWLRMMNCSKFKKNATSSSTGIELMILTTNGSWDDGMSGDLKCGNQG